MANEAPIFDLPGDSKKAMMRAAVWRRAYQLDGPVIWSRGSRV